MARRVNLTDSRDMMRIQRGVMILMVLLLGSSLGAQEVRAQEAEPGPSLVEQAQAAYEELDYAAAEDYAQQVLRNYEAYGIEQLVEVHAILGLINASQNQQVDARRHFRAALSLDPQLELDPLLVSPKILNLFEEVKQDVQGLQQPEGDEADVAVRYVVRRDPRPAAALRSMVVPGWGQLYRGERVKGWLLAGLWTASSGAAVVAHLQRRDARNAYEDARLPDVVNERYDEYAAWHKVRNNLVLAAAGVWLYAYLDAILRWPDDERQQQRVHLSAPADGPGLHLRVRF